MQEKKIKLVIAVILAAMIGSLASTQASSDLWYLSLNKSELNPPSYVFGIVWPILYVLMMISAYLAYKKIYGIFLIQLAFNAAWSWLFFRFQMPLIALLDIYLLIAIIGLIYYFVFLLILTPLIGRFEKPKALPASISQIYQENHN